MGKVHERGTRTEQEGGDGEAAVGPLQGPIPQGAALAKGERPKCLVIAQRGIQTSGQFAQMMGAMMADLVEGNISPQVGNAVTNAGGKLLKVVEMQMKYGTACNDKNEKSLILVPPTPAPALVAA